MGLQQGLDAIQLIHQAFESGYQNELQRKKQAQDQSLALDANKRANEELQLHRDTTAAQLKTQLAQLEQMHFENKSKMLELLRSGALQGNTQETVGQDAYGNQIPNAAGLPNQPTVKSPVTFNGETVDNYQLPGEAIQQNIEGQKQQIQQLAPIQANAKALETTAVGNAETPFADAATARKITEGTAIQAPEIASHEKIAAAAQDAENKRAILNANTTLAGHRIAAEASNYNARMNNFMDPSQLGALTQQAQLAFGGAPMNLTGKPKEAVELIGARTGQVIPDSKDIDKIKAVPSALDTVNMIKDFSNKYGTDSKVQAYLNGKLAETDLPSDIRANLDAINTRAISFSKTFEGTQGIKFTNQDLKLVLGGMVKVGATSPQNKLLSDNLSKMIGLAANTALVRYSPEQREHILTTQGFFNDVPPTSSKGGALDKKTTINNFLKTGKFVPVYN